MKASRLACAIILFLGTIWPHTLLAQTTPSISGSVSDPTGKPIPEAKISAKNVETGQISVVVSDSLGHFSLPFASPGQYETSASAPGFAAKVQTVSLPTSTLSFTLAQASSNGPGNLPNAPSSSQTAPSLSDRGFPPEQTQSNTKEQALLDKRTHMLKSTRGLDSSRPPPWSQRLSPRSEPEAKRLATPIALCT